MVTPHLHIQLLIALSCAVIVHGVEPALLRCDRKRDALFKRVEKDRKLSGHVIESHDVASPLDCAGKCLETSGCKSYNYQETGSPHHVCQLNNQSKSSASSSDYVIQEGFSYYDAEQHVLEAFPACLSSPCRNGGTCRLAGCNDDFTCDCTEDFSGEYCKKWIGSDGSTSARPGHSCFYINKYGKAKGDGDYWIDPTRSGKPFLVSCDMTTDGGGWTIVHNCTLKTSSPSGVKEEVPDYRLMKDLTLYKTINTNILQSLRSDMGFNQMRIFCHKKAVNRTVHLMTRRNELGHDVIRYFTRRNADTPATACNSYITMPDDTSILSKDCNKLGYTTSKGSYLNQWGKMDSHKGKHRLYNRILNHSPSGRTVSFYGQSAFCDDHDNNNLMPGDSWVWYVR